MKKRHLLFLASTIALVIGGILLMSNQNSNYHPRNSKAPVADYYGAAEYYHMMKANPETGEFDLDSYLAIKESANALNESKNGSALNIAWDEVGPDNIGGRTRAILIISDELMFAGSVTGGLFKSDNKGNTWERVPGFNKNYAISTMAVLGNGNIYIGTGNSHEFAEGYGGSGSIGGGLFVSTDNGVTWNYAQDEGNDIKPSSLTVDAEYAIIDKIVADPTDANRLWVGYNRALKPYIDGEGFLSVPNGLPAAACEDVDISADGSVILASLGSSDAYVSNNGGDSFILVTGAEDGQIQDGLVRLEFAISPDDENYVYAAVAIPGRIGKFDGVYSSIDKGNTWTKIWMVSPNSDPDPGEQAFYDLAISVVPGDKDAFVLGALSVWSGGNLATPQQRSIAGWPFFSPGSDITNITPPGQEVNGYTVAVHADVHVFEWDDEGRLYTGTDGGIFKSEDFAFTFIHSNRFYNVTQFYAIGYSANDLVLGGSQDNGTAYMFKNGSTEQEAINVSPGDGFDCEVSNLEPTGDIAFATIQGGQLFRGSFEQQTGGPFWSPEMDDYIGFGVGPFHTQMRLWESKNENTPYIVNYRNESGDLIPAGTEIDYSSNTLSVPLTATLDDDLPVDSTVAFPDPVTSLMATGFVDDGGVWVTRNALQLTVTDGWSKVMNAVSGTVTALEWSKADGNYLFVGTSTGIIYRISGFANAYTVEEMQWDSAQYALDVQTIYTGTAPILDIAVDPNDPDHLVAARAGFGGSGKVIESFNAATVPNPGFADIWFTSGNLVGLPAYSVVIEQDDPNVIFAGTEFGIYSTTDGGANWSSEGEDPMGSFPIYDLRQQWRSPNDVENAGYIYVGSHGRGAFKSTAFAKNGIDDVDEPESNELVADLLIAPNPMTTYGRLEFTSDNEGMINMDIYSIAGQRVKSLQFAMNKGANNYRFDVSDLNHGTYIIQLNKDNKVTTKKFVIIR